MTKSWPRIKQIAVVSLILLTSCQREKPNQKSVAHASIPSMQTLSTLATRACKCKMAGHDSGAIDREFARLTAHLSQEPQGSASTPLSYEITCFPELGNTACVTNAIVASGLGDGAFVCTDAEADELEKLWSSKLHRGALPSTKSSDTALLKRINGMRADTKKALPQFACDNP